LRMLPACDLVRRQAQAGELEGYRIVADIGIDQDVEFLIEKRLCPLLQSPAAFLEARGAGSCELGLLIPRSAQVERVQGESPGIDVVEPAPDDGVPHRMVPEVLRYHAHARCPGTIAR